MAKVGQPVRELGDGLVLRWSTAHDIDRVGELAAEVFRSADQPPNERQLAWVRDLGSGRHPLTGPEQGVFVEDTRSGKVVASMWLIPQVWSYDGVSFGVGRPEQVATHPDYRNRGLVRALFEAFHQHSSAAGEQAQAITGIEYFYRQFGYEYALDLGGTREVSLADVPKLKDGEAEAYRLRQATPGDVPLVMALYERGRKNSQVSTDIPEAYWHWLIDGVNHDSGDGWQAQLIEDTSGQPCGYVVHRSRRWASTLDIFNVGLLEGNSYVTLVRPLLRLLGELASAVPMMLGREAKAADKLNFGLGATHPLYDALGTSLVSHSNPPYAWYVRVPDVPGLLRHLAPALERRLPGTAGEGFSGELPISFFKGGVRLVFERGRLTTSEPWQRPERSEIPGAGFPPLVFLQLLFGRRSLDELRYAYPDVWSSDEITPLLEALFPRSYSLTIPLD